MLSIIIIWSNVKHNRNMVNVKHNRNMVIVNHKLNGRNIKHEPELSFPYYLRHKHMQRLKGALTEEEINLLHRSSQIASQRDLMTKLLSSNALVVLMTTWRRRTHKQNQLLISKAESSNLITKNERYIHRCFVESSLL